MQKMIIKIEHSYVLQKTLIIDDITETLVTLVRRNKHLTVRSIVASNNLSLSGQHG